MKLNLSLLSRYNQNFGDNVIMYRYILFALVVAGSANAALLNSPCPNVFTYEGEPENDRWYGIMRFSSNIELLGLIYKIQLDRPGQLLVSWDGEVRSDDNINFSVFDPKHFQRPGEEVKARIMVKFHPSSNPPNVVKIIINGNIMCSGTVDGNNGYNSGYTIETSTVGRPDPVSLDEDIVSEYNNRPNNLNTNSGNNEKGNNKPAYYESNYNNNGGGAGTNYNGASGSNHNYGQGESNYANSNYQPPSSATRPSSYPNNNNNNNQNYGSSGYNNPANNYVPAENVVYPANHQPQSQQWSTDNQQQTSYNINANRNNNSGQVVSNNGPLVTTLTLPNNTQNKNNVDTIIQIIKNQLEQQQVTSNTNNTVIVALVSPVQTANHAVQQTAPNTSQSRESLIETTTHKTTTTNTQSSAVASKVRSTTPATSSTKNPSSRNKD